MGYIFLCSNLTEQECLERNLLGGAEGYRKRVKGLAVGDRLYLYNYNTKMLIGSFEALSGLQENIVPDAWRGDFPWQVKVNRISTPKSISIDDIRNDDELKNYIKFDRSSRPTSHFDTEAVHALERLFQSQVRLSPRNNETPFTASDGHRVRSQAELEIDNWLFSHRIAHGYETRLPKAKRCDFEVPTQTGSIYIEYWGMSDDQYLKDKKEKQEIYAEHNLHLVEIEPKDLKHLDKILSDRVLRFLT